MIKLAKKNNPAADFKVMDGREIHRLASRFDAIICGFCMPYLSKEDCTKLVKDAAALLNSGGIFYFSLLEDDHGKSGYETNSKGDKMYVYYYQEDYLQKTLKENNFEPVELKRKDCAKTKEMNSTHLIVIARKK